MFCDAQGRLSISAVAEHPNGIQLAQMIQEGIELETLSHKMDVEEPTAASIISQALNVSQELALRTSELTTVSVLRGDDFADGTNPQPESSLQECVRACAS